MFDRIVTMQRTRFYFVETVFMLMALVAINLYFIPGKPAFEGINPNPLWIVILAISARYGRDGAIFAGIMTSAVFIAHYAAADGIDIFYDDLWLLRFPFLFLLIGFLIGEVRTVFILREDYLTSRIQELENLNDNLKKENEIVKEAHRDLTMDVATSRDTITILNEITKKFKSVNVDDIYNGILNSFSEFLKAEECSFYEAEGNRLALKESKGWKDYYRRPESYELGRGLIGISALKRKILSIKDVVLGKAVPDEEQSDLLGDSVIAIPVIGLEDRIYGVASIEKIPLTELTDSTIQAARITCELAASSLNNAYAFKEMQKKQIKDYEYDIYKYHHFLARLDEEFNRCINYMLPLSVIAFKWPTISALPPERRSVMLRSIIELIRLNTRAFDVLAHGPTKDIPLVLLLATTSGPQAEGLRDKIAAKVHEYEFDKIINAASADDGMTVVEYNPHKIKTPEELLKMAGL